MFNHELIESTLLLLLLSMTRIVAAFTIMPIMGAQVMGGRMLKNGVALSMALFIFPVVQYEYELKDIDGLLMVGVILKEIFIGIILGFGVSIIFWGVEAVGFFIDNQRGATMASSLNPLSGSQASPLGILLTQAVNTVFFTSGGILVFMGMVYQSYVAWPIFSFFPSFDMAMVGFFLGLLDLLLYYMMLFAGPVIIAMFMAEFGLALVGRFAPQMDVFFLAMPVKSAVAMAMLMVYVGFIIHFFSNELAELPMMFTHLADGILSR